MLVSWECWGCCCCCWRQDGVTWTKVHVRTPEQPLGLKPRLIDGEPPRPQTHVYVLRPSPGTPESSARVFQDPLRNEGRLARSLRPRRFCRLQVCGSDRCGAARLEQHRVWKEGQSCGVLRRQLLSLGGWWAGRRFRA